MPDPITPDLAAWLLADDGPIATDERMAREAAAPPWEPRRYGIDSEIWSVGAHRIVLRGGMASHEARANGEHIAAWDPARVLAECAAKRKIVEAHPPANVSSLGADCGTCCYTEGYGMINQNWPCPTLLALAQPYAGRPGWHDEWRTP